MENQIHSENLETNDPAQGAALSKLSARESIEKLRQLIGPIGVAMLTTTAPDGSLHTRPMVTQELDEDGDLWFFTNGRSPKSDELANNPHVNAAYVDESKGTFVSVTGSAYVVDDRVRAEELWSPSVEAWFPEGLEDPDLMLIRVKVWTAEYWERTGNFASRAIEFARASLSGDIPHVAENKILKVS